MSLDASTSLGTFLKIRRTRLDPAAFGFSGRRRTPGLRREEVAQRANISSTWYTWLEQGRGGAPSGDVLNRIANALMLTETEREHLFLLGLGRPPQMRQRAEDAISPRLQRLLDRFEVCPAIVKTATWDVVGWNRAACVVLTDYAALPPAGRNILRILFCNPAMQEKQQDWEALARFVVGAFRADAVRAGRTADIDGLVEEICRESPQFEALWRENEVLGHGDGVKWLTHAQLGRIELEFSTFAIDGRPDLALIVYNPVDPVVTERIREMVSLE